jgi:hypothetical protein
MKHEPARNVLVAAVVTEAAAGAVAVRGVIRRKDGELPLYTDRFANPEQNWKCHTVRRFSGKGVLGVLLIPGSAPVPVAPVGVSPTDKGFRRDAENNGRQHGKSAT